MNDRFKALIKESDLEECIDDAYLMRNDWQPFIEKFAELIVKECITVLDLDDGATIHSELLEEHFGVK